METQARAKPPNSYDVAVQIFQHFEERPDEHVITITRGKLLEVSQRTVITRKLLTELDYNLGYFDLIMGWGGEAYVISRDANFAPYTGSIATLGQGACYDEAQEQDSQAEE